MERVVFDLKNATDLDHYAMNLHLHCYAFAHQFIFRKSVLDAACGTCFGSMIYSTAAKSIVCIDRDREAILHGGKLPFFCPTEWMVKDLDKDLLPAADVCISIETIEHLNGNGFFLKNLKVKELVFTVPINMPGEYHRLVFHTTGEAVAYLAEHGWKVNIMLTVKDLKGEEMELMGVAERIETKKKLSIVR